MLQLSSSGRRKLVVGTSRVGSAACASPLRRGAAVFGKFVVEVCREWRVHRGRMAVRPVLAVRSAGGAASRLGPNASHAARTLHEAYATHAATRVGGRANSLAWRRRFWSMAGSVNSNWVPRGPRNRSRPGRRNSLKWANSISMRSLAVGLLEGRSLGARSRHVAAVLVDIAHDRERVEMRFARSKTHHGFWRDPLPRRHAPLARHPSALRRLARQADHPVGHPSPLLGPARSILIPIDGGEARQRGQTEARRGLLVAWFFAGS
jgi:hypothetical protein